MTALVKPEMGRRHRNIAHGELCHEQAGIVATHECYGCDSVDGIFRGRNFGIGVFQSETYADIDGFACLDGRRRDK